MKYLAIIPATLALAIPNPAGRPTDIPLVESLGVVYSGLPPARYWNEGVAVVAYVDDVTLFCNVTIPEGATLKACTKVLKNGSPVNILPNPCTAALKGDGYATIVCHEWAHSQLWPGDHPL